MPSPDKNLENCPNCDTAHPISKKMPNFAGTAVDSLIIIPHFLTVLCHVQSKAVSLFLILAVFNPFERFYIPDLSLNLYRCNL